MASLSTSAPGAELSGAPLLQLEDVAKAYGGKVAIYVDRLDVRDGDVINFIGANASGKSTLLRLLAGITRPSKGQVRKSAEARHLRLVLVPQGGGLYPALTLLENIEVIGRLFGVSIDDDERAIPGLYELGLHELVDSRIGELSGGYRRLAAIAVAAAIKPDGLFIDEPFAALDPHKTELLHGFLAGMRDNLRFIAVTGHENDAAAGRFGRTLRCVDGRLMTEAS
jgi:ABC-type multidrug transport system ATPase subunit